MKPTPLKIALLAGIVLLGLLIYLLFVPRTYNVPPVNPLPGVQYWDLATGSKIAVYRIPARGDKKQTPVLFLQGGPGSPVYPRNLEDLSPLADDGYDVYLYDLAGCGLSGRFSKISEYTAERHTKDLDEIVRKIGANRIILIGQSWGATLATLYMANYPGIVEKAVFTGPGPLLPVNNDRGRMVPPDTLQLKIVKYALREEREKLFNLRARLVEYCAQALNLKIASDEEMDAFQSLITYELGKTTVCNASARDRLEPGAGFYCQVKTVQSFSEIADVRPKLAGNPTPVLILRGQCDHIRWGFASEYKEIFPNATITIVPEAGHSISLEQPGIYINAIRSFLHPPDSTQSSSR